MKDTKIAFFNQTLCVFVKIDVIMQNYGLPAVSEYNENNTVLGDNFQYFFLQYYCISVQNILDVKL